MHFSEGFYEKTAQRFFTTLNYDTFLECDDPRSGGFEPFASCASWRRPRLLHRARAQVSTRSWPTLA